MDPTSTPTYNPTPPPPAPPPFQTSSYGLHPLQLLYHHIPPTQTTKVTILFIHGGAFRHPPFEPLWQCTPRVALPLFSHLERELGGGDGEEEGVNVNNVGFISTGYRLAGPHPEYGGIAPFVGWREMVEDLCVVWEKFIDRAVGEGETRKPVVVVGHSVGAALGLEVLGRMGGAGDVLVGVEGIYNFEALVEEYPGYRGWVEAGLGCKVEEGVVKGAAGSGEGEGWKGRVARVWSVEDELLGEGQVRCAVEGYGGTAETRSGRWGGHDECLDAGVVESGVGSVVAEVVREVLEKGSQ